MCVFFLDQTLMVLLFRLLGVLNEGELLWERSSGVKHSRAKLQVRILRKKVLFYQTLMVLHFRLLGLLNKGERWRHCDLSYMARPLLPLELLWMMETDAPSSSTGTRGAIVLVD